MTVFEKSHSSYYMRAYSSCFATLRYDMAVQILQDEVGHEEDLQALLEDPTMMLTRTGR